MLVWCGLLASRNGRLYLTATARAFLLPASPNYWGPMLALWKETTIDHSALLAGVRSRDTRRPQQGAEDLWALHEANLEQARKFTAAMDAHSRLPAAGVAATGAFSEARRMLDVGGGSGRFSIALAQAHLELSSTIMDLPSVGPIARAYVDQEGVADRVDVIAWDMFADLWPEGYDAVFFSEIFHDWTPEQCAGLTRRAFSALPSGGSIHVHEMLKTEVEGGPETAAAYGLDMLMYTEGRQYRGSEVGAMLTQAGFRDIVFRQTSGYFWLVSARKP
jgi:predicted O-methyltransferase YrrM